MTKQTITPNKLKTLRKHIKQQFAEIRADLVEVRRLRQEGGFLNLEDAQDILEFALYHKHNLLRDSIRKLATVEVVKYSNLSPAAAVRMQKMHEDR